MTAPLYRNILILGGAGYIGAALHPYLRSTKIEGKHGFMVRSVDLMARGAYCHPKNEKRNYRDSSVRKMVEKADDVVLLAGHSSVAACLEDPRQAVDNNVMGAVELCGVMRPEQRLVYASSGSVHDIALRSVYDASKRALDELMPVLHPMSWGLRFGTVAGMSPNMRWDTMVNAMVRSAMVDGVVRVRNRALVRPILHIEDLCEGVRRILWGEVPVGNWDMASQADTIGGIAERVAGRYGATVAVQDDDGGYSFQMRGRGLVQKPSPWFCILDSVEFAVSGAHPVRRTA